MQLTSEQETAVNGIFTLVKEAIGTGKTIKLGGYAGTGKTTVLKELREILSERYDVAYTAYTGRAAKVLSNAIDAPATTLHSTIYKPIYDEDGSIAGWELRHIDTQVIVIDEASMISEDIHNDLQHLKRTIKIYVGDHFQLPPVMDNFLPLSNLDFELKKIHRNSGAIVKLANAVRQGEILSKGELGSGVYRGHRSEMSDNDEVMEILAGQKDDMLFITNYNKIRQQMNSRIECHRGNDSGLPIKGSRIICLRNNRGEGLYNGMLGYVDEFEVRNDEVAKLTFTNEEEQRLCYVYHPAFMSEKGMIPQTAQKKVFEHIGKSEYAEFKVNLFDFANVITCHKAQGSEADYVVVLGEWFGKDKARWLYTAMTRAKKKLWLYT